MSYAKFLDDVESLLVKKKQAGLLEKGPIEPYFDAVRDRWLKDEKYDALMKFVHTNWDSGNCDSFIEPFEEVLILRGDAARYKKLWGNILRWRLMNLERYLKYLKKENPKFDWLTISQIDVTDFAVHDRRSYEDLSRVVSYHRQFTLNGIERYLTGLRRLNESDEIQAMITLAERVSRLVGLKTPKVIK
jgi:hypothetical protein